jgi:hypothetical protein
LPGFLVAFAVLTDLTDCGLAVKMGQENYVDVVLSKPDCGGAAEQAAETHVLNQGTALVGP